MDITKTEYKKISNQIWKFEFRQNGYVKVSDKTTVKKGKKDVEIWRVGLHGTSIEACLQYVYSTFNGKVPFLKYDELETVKIS